jgi:hypothetical protein
MKFVHIKLLIYMRWRDHTSADLQAAKGREGLGKRNHIQPSLHLHDVEEEKTPRKS